MNTSPLQNLTTFSIVSVSYALLLVSLLQIYLWMWPWIFSPKPLHRWILCVVRHIGFTCNPNNTQEAKAGWSLVYGQPGLHSKVLYQKEKGLAITNWISVFSWISRVSYLDMKKQTSPSKENEIQKCRLGNSLRSSGTRCLAHTV